MFVIPEKGHYSYFENCHVLFQTNNSSEIGINEYKQQSSKKDFRVSSL